MNGEIDWPAAIHRVFRAENVRQVAYVPDAGHARLIELCREDPDMTAVPLTIEEEGVALLAGAWLGGARGALLMQSSGVGNCINMFSLTETCRLPLLLLVTMRGEWAEFNPWQVPMGRNTQALLETCGASCFRPESAATVEETVTAAARLAFASYRHAAVLLGQRLIGSKAFEE